MSRALAEQGAWRQDKFVHSDFEQPQDGAEEGESHDGEDVGPPRNTAMPSAVVLNTLLEYTSNVSNTYMNEGVGTPGGASTRNWVIVWGVQRFGYEVRDACYR